LQLELYQKDIPYENPLLAASIDRIDNKIGYMQGNIQFVATAINLAKQHHDEAYVHMFLNLIKTHYTSPPAKMHHEPRPTNNLIDRLFSNRQGEETASHEYGHGH